MKNNEDKMDGLANAINSLLGGNGHPDYEDNGVKWWLLTSYKSGFHLYRVIGPDIDDFSIVKDGELYGTSGGYESICCKMDAVRFANGVDIFTDDTSFRRCDS